MALPRVVETQVLSDHTNLFFARDLALTRQRLDAGEELDVVCLPVSEVLKRIRCGEFIDGSLQLGVLLAHYKGLLGDGGRSGVP